MYPVQHCPDGSLACEDWQALRGKDQVPPELVAAAAFPVIEGIWRFMRKMTSPLSLEAATHSTIASSADAHDRGTAAAPEVTVAASAKELGADEEDHDRDHDDHTGKAGEDHGGGSSMRFPRRMKKCIAQLREARIGLKRLLTSYKPPIVKEEKELTGVEGELAKAKERVDEKRAVEAEEKAKVDAEEAKRKAKEAKKKKKLSPEEQAAAAKRKEERRKSLAEGKGAEL